MGASDTVMANAYRHPPRWYNPKVLGPRSVLLAPTFRIADREKAEEDDLNPAVKAAGDVRAHCLP